jgi:hypothetical protein
MTTSASPRTLWSEPPDSALASVSGLTIMNVALGPSLSHWHDGLQRRLGGDWVVEELISAQPPPGENIRVLGTTELAPGRIESVRSGSRTSLLVGTGQQYSAPDSGDDSAREVLDRLSDLLRTSVATSLPMVERRVIHSC